jgi:hypothetical protein
MFRTAVVALTFSVIGCAGESAPSGVTGPSVTVGSVSQGSFVAIVSGPMTKPVGCPPGVFACGDAVITGYGSGIYGYTFISFERTGPACGFYTATVSFRLEDTSTLTLQESGTVCGPGKSFFATPGSSYGNPAYGEGTWSVTDASGQFAGLTGEGTNTFHIAGAALSAVYTGAL